MFIFLTDLVLSTGFYIGYWVVKKTFNGLYYSIEYILSDDPISYQLAITNN